MPYIEFIFGCDADWPIKQGYNRASDDDETDAAFRIGPFVIVWGRWES